MLSGVGFDDARDSNLQEAKMKEVLKYILFILAAVAVTAVYAVLSLIIYVPTLLIKQVERVRDSLEDWANK